ncbi:hypothetical protein AC739_19105 [Planococcus glaciei]|uniref:hypothetical protein n=1 Tax=Planococcus glaciei TaxID=459472 RepID=UPI00069D1446|nr:hypothetical protein [Planococcus glaciei]KOF08649.1 hypothetical protein AC739_19105 [Planococcus glaciei]
MWAAIAGVITFMYVAIFSLLKASSHGAETSRKHRAALLIDKEEIPSTEKVEGINMEEKLIYKSEAHSTSAND